MQMKKILLSIAVLALSAPVFAQVETSGLDPEKNEIFMKEHLYKLDEFGKGTVVFDQDAALYEEDGTPITLHPSQGIININNLHQCIVMINGNDTIPLLYEEHVVKVNTGKNMFLKIKGIYYRVIEYNESILAQMETLQAIDMGKKDIYGTSSQLSATTNISSLSSEGGGVQQLTPNTEMRYTYEQRPVFINGNKVAMFNEKQLCKIYKKKSAIVKEYFAKNNVDPYSMDQARELYALLIQ